MNSSQVYRVSWTDAKHGVTVYDTLSESVARGIHSDLMCRQLAKEGITDVKATIVGM